MPRPSFLSFLSTPRIPLLLTHPPFVFCEHSSQTLCEDCNSSEIILDFISHKAHLGPIGTGHHRHGHQARLRRGPSSVHCAQKRNWLEVREVHVNSIPGKVEVAWRGPTEEGPQWKHYCNNYQLRHEALHAQPPMLFDAFAYRACSLLHLWHWGTTLLLCFVLSVCVNRVCQIYKFLVDELNEPFVLFNETAYHTDKATAFGEGDYNKQMQERVHIWNWVLRELNLSFWYLFPFFMHNWITLQRCSCQGLWMQMYPYWRSSDTSQMPITTCSHTLLTTSFTGLHWSQWLL